ncbi:MAG: hypothetical protein QTN59_13735 [Candidatus Electrothrix communis]|nr:MAG: hypothetical protein QTN59_13735 [Candidatus Electrothrix communis]
MGITTQPGNLSLSNTSRKKIIPKETWPQDLLDPTYLTPDTLTIVFEETGIDIKHSLTNQSLTAVEKKYPFITAKQYEELSSEKDKNFKEGDPTWVKVAGVLARLELLRQGLTSRYIIEDSLLAKLEQAEIPQYILAGLAEKKGAVYIDLSMLRKGFQRQIQETILAYKPEVMEQANFLNMVYFLNEKSFLILKGKELPPELVDSLAPLNDQYFLSKSKLSRDVRKILAQFADTVEQTWLKKIVDIAEQEGRLYMIKGQTLQQLLVKLPPKLAKDIKKENLEGFTAASLCTRLEEKPALLQNYFRQNPHLIPLLGLQVITQYNPTLDTATQIQQHGVSSVVVAAVKKIEGNTYTSKESYIRALRLALGKLEQPTPPCPAPTPTPKQPVVYTPTECSVEPELVPSKIAQALFDLEEQNAPYKTTPIQFSSGDCGCVTVQKNSTYALYPYWTAQGEKQEIDFSNISRLAYFYLELDKKNKITDQRHWLDDKEKNKFITLARRHKTKVDLVLYKEQWCGQQNSCPSRRANEELADTISDLLKPTLNHLKPYVTFGIAPTPTMGDGIVIYLTDLPHDSSCFFSFIKVLRKKLQAPVRDTTLGARITHLFGKPPQRVPERKLSLMLPNDIIPQEAWPQDLIDFFIELSQEPTQYFDNILVLIGDSPLEKEKNLRKSIEGQVGDEHASINKKIIPLFTNTCVQEPDDKNIDLAFNYAQGNFGGIGFIPFSLQSPNPTKPEQIDEEKSVEDSSAKEEGEEEGKKEPATVCNNIISDQAMNTFATGCQTEQVDIVSRLIKRYVPGLCKWACPNRMWIRLAWDCLLLFFAIYSILSFFYPTLAEFYQKNSYLFVIIAVIMALLIYISYACDPDYKEYTTDLLIYTLIILAVGIAYSARKRAYP